MTEKSLEVAVNELLTGDARRNALDFAAFLRANGMVFERGGGYWEDKFYWMIKFYDGYVCFILVNGTLDNGEPEGWIIWSDDSGSKWYADAPELTDLDEHTKEIAWKNVDFCGHCGSCQNPGGTRKMVFGKDFDGVCITTMRFNNPDDETVESVKKLVKLRKNDILVGNG